MTALLAMVATVGMLCASAPDAPDESLTSTEYLSEVARHLYRWHLDEAEVRPEIHAGEFVFRVRELHPALDEGDRSRFAEITLPRLGIRVLVKKADYEVPELDLHVVNERYMIADVSRLEPEEAAAAGAAAGATEVRLAYPALRNRLFETRHEHQPPDDAMVERLRGVAGERARRHRAARGQPAPQGPQTFHLAPISPIANESWVFWEDGDLLFRFHADIDISDPAMWAHQDVAVQIFDLEEQVVVSLDEVGGANAYVTRDMVGRVLYNCIVLGRRVELGAAAPPPAEPAAEEAPAPSKAP